MRKPTFCTCENKDADQLRGNCKADQRLCFRYIDSTIPVLSKCEILNKDSDQSGHLKTLVRLGGWKDQMNRVMRKPTFWFPAWSNTNQTVQPHKMARGLKFRIYEVGGLYYLCSENKGADQLRGYREADLRLCFRICKMLVFS